MAKKELPKEMIKSRKKQWDAVYLVQLLDKIPPRIKKVLQELHKKENIKNPTYPIQSHFLAGKSRTGKTVYAYKLLFGWHREQYANMLSTDFEFITVTELLAEFRKTYVEKEPKFTEAQILKKYKKVKLLILDDFGAEKTTEWAYQMLYMLIAYRYDYEMTTIYTSNFTLEELTKKLGDDRITSRISHECKGNIITFTNKPYI